jgi:hypothetical protein
MARDLLAPATRPRDAPNPRRATSRRAEPAGQDFRPPENRPAANVPASPEQGAADVRPAVSKGQICPAAGRHEFRCLAPMKPVTPLKPTWQALPGTPGSVEKNRGPHAMHSSPGPPLVTSPSSQARRRTTTYGHGLAQGCGLP